MKLADPKSKAIGIVKNNEMIDNETSHGKEKHLPQWNELKILGKEEHWVVRH